MCFWQQHKKIQKNHYYYFGKKKCLTLCVQSTENIIKVRCKNRWTHKQDRDNAVSTQLWWQTYIRKKKMWDARGSTQLVVNMKKEKKIFFSHLLMAAVNNLSPIDFYYYVRLFRFCFQILCVQFFFFLLFVFSSMMFQGTSAGRKNWL